MKRNPRLYLEDILQSIDAIQEYTKNITKRKFSKSILEQDAVVRRLEIIGEAVRQLPQEVKELHPSVPWRKIAGMRNRITHEYFGIILDRVWQVIQKDLNSLKQQIEAILKEYS